MIAVSVQMWINLGTSVLAGIIVTIAVLLTGILFNNIRDALPAGSLFHGIKNVSDPCLIFIRRMTDSEKTGKFKTPRPSYKTILDDSNTPYCPKFDENRNIPWVTSTHTAQAMAHILNVLGRVGRTDNIQLTYHDKDFDRWDAPIFIIGAGWKRDRAIRTCNPYFRLTENGVSLIGTEGLFAPRTSQEDIGILQKMINPNNDQPIWILNGYRGTAVVAASYSLVRLWKHLGWLYGNKPFGLLLRVNDKDGWQQYNIIRLHPIPKLHTKLRHPYSWHVLKKNYKQSEPFIQRRSK